MNDIKLIKYIKQSFSVWLYLRITWGGGAVKIPVPRYYLGEGNGNPLQCPCLENPMDRGAWWAAIYGVAQSQRRLKRLSSSSSSSSSSNYLTEVKLESFDMGLRHQYFVNFPADSNMPPSLRTIALESKEGNGTPLQYSCLENPMDRGAW